MRRWFPLADARSWLDAAAVVLGGSLVGVSAAIWANPDPHDLNPPSDGAVRGAILVATLLICIGVCIAGVTHTGTRKQAMAVVAFVATLPPAAIAALLCFYVLAEKGFGEVPFDFVIATIGSGLCVLGTADFMENGGD